MSVRLVSLTPRLNRALSRRAGSGLRAYLPKFARSSAGDVRLNLSFCADRDDDLVDQRVAEAGHLAPDAA